MYDFWRKLAGRIRGGALDSELEEEMRIHLEMKAADPRDMQAARRQFGNVTLLVEDSRNAWTWPGLEAWLRDFRYALRMVARKPGFTAAVALTLALGIGTSSAIFSLIDTVLIRPLPYPDSARLVAVHEASVADPSTRTPVSPGRLDDWQRLARAFAGLAGSQADTLTDTTGQLPERLSSAYVSRGFFAVLATPPAHGRTFTVAEEQAGGPLAAVISENFWRRRFAGDPAALGGTLILDGRHYLVTGVMPRTFQYPSPAIDVWLPKQAGAAVLRLREARAYRGVARLKPGVSLPQARADLGSVQARLAEQYPKTDAGWTVAIDPLRDEVVGPVRTALWLLFGSVSLLLLTACANVACLLLTRLNGRTAEIAMRCSLGAGRVSIARQLFAESIVYAALGGLLGMGAAFAAIDLLRREIPDLPRMSELAIDSRMLSLAASISVLAAVLFSLAPIAQTFRRDLAPLILRAGRGLIGTRQRLPRLLVATQLALATALVVGAGLLLRSLARLQETPLGFHPDHVLSLHVGASFSEPAAETIQRHQRILGALASIPGVASVAMSSGLPGVDSTWPREFEIAGQPGPGGVLRFAHWRVVTAAYFQTAGIPILEGHTCRMDTSTSRAFEAVVNRSFAVRYFPRGDAVGHTILEGPQGDNAARIVGLVADAREDGPATEPQPLIYACGYLRYWADSDFLVQAGDPPSVAAAVRSAVAGVDPAHPVYAIRTLPDALSGALAQTRFRTLVVALFSMIALALAAIGLYGVMAYMVSQRAQEIGIRLALGARPGQILAEILQAGGILAGAGALAGVAFAAAAFRILGSVLHGVQASDAVAYLGATAVLFLVALLACLIPGRRATSIDPVQALRAP